MPNYALPSPCSPAWLLSHQHTNHIVLPYRKDQQSPLGLGVCPGHLSSSAQLAVTHYTEREPIRMISWGLQAPFGLCQNIVISLWDPVAQ